MSPWFLIIFFKRYGPAPTFPPALKFSLSKNTVEVVVLTDNGFGGPPAGMHHWQILNTTKGSMKGGKKGGGGEKGMGG